MKTSNRILIDSNQIRVGTITNQAREAAATVNRLLLPALEELGIAPTEAVVKECIINGSATMTAYFEGVRKDVENIKTASIKKRMIAEANKAWDEVNDAFMHTRSEAGKFAKYLSFDEGKCVMTPEAEEELADLHRIYLNEPAEIAAYKLHVEIAEKLNQLFGNRAPLFWIRIFTEDATGKLHPTDCTDYSKLA